MKNKFIKFFLLLFLLLPKNVLASDGIVARIGDNYYDLLSDAIEAAGSDDVIKLTSSITFRDTQNINKPITIDLNGHNILGESIVFKVQNGSLTLEGEGTVKEINPYYAPIVIKGSTNPSDTNYSNVNIGSDVFLEGWAGVFIDQNEKLAYGVNVTIDGSINSVLDVAGGKGFGVYINGNVKNKTNYPVVNIKKNSKITSLGSGIYMAGYSKVVIDGAYIEGIDSAIAIKSGILIIKDGTLYCTGVDNTPTESYSNGVNPSGASLQIESNSSYAGDIDITITGGSLRSQNSNVIYEYLANTTDTKVTNIDITGGNFLSSASKDVFNLSSSFKTTHDKFISGGRYSSDPSIYLNSGYQIEFNDERYEVIKTTMKEDLVFKEETKKSMTITTIVLSVLVVLIGTFVFVKKYFII